MIVRKIVRGFTLIEILLVLVIISIIIWASTSYLQQRALQMRIDRTSVQMQQILNAAMSYYVFNGSWPQNASNDPPLTILKSSGFLPNINIVSPWGGQAYQASFTPQQFYVWTPVTVVSSSGAYAAASVIAGSLPLGYTSTNSGSAPTTAPDATTPCQASSTTCNVVSSVNIPGQNLNNAQAVNFSGLYRQGGCVPVPTCPVDSFTGTTMTPQIMVAPVSVSGFNDQNQPNVYPISSFTAYAVGGKGSGHTPATCGPKSSTNPDCSTNTQGNIATDYWRVCMQIITEKGDVQDTNAGSAADWGGKVSLMAITRCAISNEPAGTTFNVYGN